MQPALRIAILAHSTNPRGGVVHALELGDALTRLGHEAVVHAPDASGKGFFRAPLSPAVARAGVARPEATSPPWSSAHRRLRQAFRAAREHRQFDVFHAQDGISGNALATLKERGLIQRFARTVHHIDSFQDPPPQRLADPLDRCRPTSCSSSADSGRARIMAEFGRASTHGRQRRRHRALLPAMPARLDAASARSIGMPMAARVCLPSAASRSARTRSDPRGLPAASCDIHRDAQLVIAGGASLLDHTPTGAASTR